MKTDRSNRGDQTAPRGFGIGELARRSGVRDANIRYYEEIGLLPAPARRPNGHRNYNSRDLRRALLVKNCRDLGFSIADVRSLLMLAEAANRSCSEARDLASQQLSQVRQKITELQVLEAELQQYVRDCESTCLGAPAPDCTIVSTLTTERKAAPPTTSGSCG